MQIGELITGGQCGAGAREKRIRTFATEPGNWLCKQQTLAWPHLIPLYYCMLSISGQALLCVRGFLHLYTPSIMQTASHDN